MMDSGLCRIAAQNICAKLQFLLEDTKDEI